MRWGRLHEILLATAWDVNPWCGTPDVITTRIRWAEDRRPLAEALVDAHGDRLTAPVERDSQECWLGHTPLFRDLDHVYECGELPWQALRTWDMIPDNLHELHSAAQDGVGFDRSRWRLIIDPDAPVFEVNLPRDWAALVRSHEHRAELFNWHGDGQTNDSRGRWSCRHNAWDIRLPADQPGPDPDAGASGLTIELVDGSRVPARGVLMPDWSSVSREWAGVHVTWAGILSAEGNVQDLGEGWLTMLRYWSTEQTCWLRDVFIDAEPLAGPYVSDHDRHSDSVSSEERCTADWLHFVQELGPDSALVRRLERR